MSKQASQEDKHRVNDIDDHLIAQDEEQFMVSVEQLNQARVWMQQPLDTTLVPC